MAGHVEHWFNRRWGWSRRDVFLNRTPTGWQVVGREGGSSGREVSYYFDDEAPARAMLKRMLEMVPPGFGDFKLMTANRPPEQPR